MDLSYELISQFAKLATEDKKTNTESTVYGTVVVDEHGDKYVKLDGSDQLTPLTDASADVNENERVSVLIKNHTATVTGNISSPAARTGDVQILGDQIDEVKQFDIVLAKQVNAQEGYIEELRADKATIGELQAATARIEELEATSITVEELNAVKGEFDDLIADKIDADVVNAEFATINGRLEATEADISNIEADYLEVSKKLTAAEAEIKNLDTKYATIEELEVEQARIDTLEATSLTADSATIKDLQADVGNIDTLIFGSAGGNVIQSTFANAVIAQLGNAQIKSAMIDTVSANKLDAGDISTNKVRVVSDDGKLVISDETIQISDDTRVRVQIGKDAAGDYSISIWDADGNLMFSEGGITDSAIKQAIIRNDMVKDDANISASKLNISSLFKEINDNGTETIKSNKIYLDEEKQTLDVAFTSISDDVKSQGTQLTVVQGQIEGKVWQQDIDKATGEMNTQYSSLKQNVDGISTTVAEHTTQINDIDSRVDEAQATANQNAADMANIVKDFNKDVENLQTQIDGSITTWFYEVVPTTSNEPAVNWTTTDLKNNHLGDLYYDTITGYCYRWQVQSNTYSWQRITDTDVTKALADAAAAQDTADQKRRVFYSQPTVPYEAGDLWVQGSGGDILRCQTPKTSSQSYALADWVLASKYTDDTAAKAAQADVDGVKTRMTTAETAIEQNKQAITLRATKSEVTETLKGYYTKDQSDAAIKVSADSITQTVSSTYATKESLEEANSRIEQNSDSIELRAMKSETVLTPTITDNGSRAVKIDNALRDSISGIKLYGKTTQFTTTGKNLLPYPYGQTTRTMAGVTYTDNGDGTITANGTATGTSYIDLIGFATEPLLYLPVGQYYISGCPSGGGSGVYGIHVRNASNTSVVQDFGSGAVLDVTEALSTGGLRVFIRVYSGKTASNLVFKPMIVAGNTATAYEPYTGGIPSPNPDYPQDLESIGESKNLLPMFTSQTLYGITMDVTADGTVTLNGTATAQADFYVNDIGLPSGQYTLSMGNDQTCTDVNTFFEILDSAGTRCYAQLFQSTNMVTTLNCEIATLHIRINKGIVLSDFTLSMQIEKGSVATDYESYIGNIDIKLGGKNLLPYPYYDNPGTLNGLTFTDNGDGSVTVNGTATATTSFVLRNITNKVLSPGMTYTLSGCPTGGAFGMYQLRAENSTYAQICSDSGSGVTFAAEYEKYYIFIRIWSGATVSNLVFKPMLVIGDTVAAYEPYKPPTTLTISTPDGLPGIPVSSDGNYTDSTGQQWICDEVDLGRGVYVQRIYEKVFDGTESWSLSNIQNGPTPYNRYDYHDASDPGTTMYNTMSSHFPYNGSNNPGVWLNANTSGGQFRIKWTYSTVDELKAFLASQYDSGNPVTVKYALAEPIETTLSDEQIAAFSALTNDPGYVVVQSEAEMDVELSDFATGSSVNKVSEALRAETEARLTLGETIQAEVSRSDQFGEDLEGVLKRVTTIEQTEQSFDIRVKTIEDDGVNKVATSEKGYTFDDEGLTIADSDSDLKTQITEDGMTVKTENYNLLDMTLVYENPSVGGALNGATITAEYIDFVGQHTYDYARIPVSLVGGKKYTVWIEFEVYDRPADATGTTALYFKLDSGYAQYSSITTNGTRSTVFNVSPSSDMETFMIVNVNYGSEVPAKVRFKAMLLEGTYTLAAVPPFKPYNNYTMLTANSYGVDAKNLHATTYLIVGDTSRFEDWKKNNEVRTACFWIGGGN